MSWRAHDALDRCGKIRDDRAVSSDDEWLIHQAHPSDAEAVAALSTIVQRLHHDAVPRRFKAANQLAAVGFFVEELRSPGVVILVAETNGVAIGYVYAKETEQPDTAFTHGTRALHVRHLAVDPSHQRTGVASSLVRAIEEHARGHNLDEVYLAHWDFNESAASFNASLGYTPQSHTVHKSAR